MAACHLVLALAITAWATAADAQPPPASPQPVPQSPGQTSPAPDAEVPPSADVVVVTASKYEERLLNAPVTMTVIPESVVHGVPAESLTELLPVVPGINVVQTSARDVNVTSRAATGTLSDSLLVLLDGRSIYQTREDSRKPTTTNPLF